jgi:hypothetical protein
MPKLPQIYLTDVKNISQLIQLLEQIAKQQYEIKVQPKPSETYRSIMKPWLRSKEFNTYKLT